MKIAFHTLGCKVNQYETEAMKKLLGDGYTVVPESEVADVYVINTCSVTALADRKSRQFIRRMKKRNPSGIVVATGCYVQVAEDAIKDIDEVDIILGNKEKFDLKNKIELYKRENALRSTEHAGLAKEQAKTELPENALENEKDGEEVYHKLSQVSGYKRKEEYRDVGDVISNDTRTRAYVKIEEGCNRFCTYCIVPFARGPVRSRDAGNIISEVKKIIGEGSKEIVLTGINTALYDDLNGLLARIDDLPGKFRIRLSSLEPTVVDAEFVKGLKKYKRLSHHMHLSLQSGSESVLKAMNRNYKLDDYRRITDVLRDIDPLYGITTDIIVGFPGETDKDFEDTMRFAEEMKFSRVHVFNYSQRKGTKAVDLPGKVSSPLRKERSKRLQSLADKLAIDFALKNKGSYAEVLLEEEEEGFMVGYTGNYIKAKVPVNAGVANEFYRGLITDTDENTVCIKP